MRDSSKVWMTKTPAVVLIADDDRDTRELYGFVLSQAGMTVVQAEDGHEALSMALDLLPDVIVTDLGLPILDGPALCRRLGDDRRTAHIPVIVVTGRADASELTSEGCHGVHKVIIKPCLPEELRNAVEALLPRGPSATSQG